MQHPEKLKPFVESIFSINPSFSNIFGSGLPGMSGMSNTVTGASSNSSDIINKLHYETSKFAELVSNNASKSEVESSIKNIEGYLLNLELLGQIDDRSCKILIDDMYDIAN